MCQRFADLGAPILKSLISLLFLLAGCTSKTCQIDPKLYYFPQERYIKSLPAAFPEIASEEKQQEWGKELLIARSFSEELDLYRAVTAYKRALFLMPKKNKERFLQTEYQIMLSYYLGKRYPEALETFETSDLKNVPDNFEAFPDLIVILYDLYRQTCQFEKADRVLGVIQQTNPDTAHDLSISAALTTGNIPLARWLSNGHPACAEFDHFFSKFHYEAKSVGKARFLNAVLPGAGYYYAGQTSSAVTSFLINAIFIATTWQFANHDLYFPAIISGSLELGWYFGGINGAGLAVKQYNERLYESSAKDLMIKQRLFPVLMIQKGF